MQALGDTVGDPTELSSLFGAVFIPTAKDRDCVRMALQRMPFEVKPAVGPVAEPMSISEAWLVADPGDVDISLDFSS